MIQWRARLARCLILAGLTMAVLGAPCALAGNEKELLAPTGKLRVGVYPGSPTSMVSDKATGQTRGVSYELGRELATRLGVSAEYVTLPRISDVLDAMKAGQVDFTVSNATPARANDVAFTQPLLAVELGYLVPANSAITAIDQIDRPGVRLGVTKGSTSEKTLPARFKEAKIVAAENVKLAIGMLGRGELDLYATNKAILFEMSDALPGARILDGNWGLEHLAIAIPRGREPALPFLADFVAELQASGRLGQIQRDAGLRGAVKAEAK